MLRSNPLLPNFGVAAGVGYEGEEARNATHGNFPMIHRTHLEIFGGLYPPTFSNWYADPWLCDIYQPFGSFFHAAHAGVALPPSLHSILVIDRQVRPNCLSGIHHHSVFDQRICLMWPICCWDDAGCSRSDTFGTTSSQTDGLTTQMRPTQRGAPCKTGSGSIPQQEKHSLFAQRGYHSAGPRQWQPLTCVGVFPHATGDSSATEATTSSVAATICGTHSWNAGCRGVIPRLTLQGESARTLRLNIWAASAQRARCSRRQNGKKSPAQKLTWCA